jgi:carboxyl-terminal processing protease
LKKSHFLLFFLTSILFSQNNKSACETLDRINKTIRYQHYRSKPIDDSLSVYVFNRIISNLDEDNRLFLEDEVTSLKRHQYLIDDYISSKRCDFLDDIFITYNKAVVRYSKIVNAISNSSFEFKSNDTIQFSNTNFPYAQDEVELTKIYKKGILFRILKEVSEVSTNKDSLENHLSEIAFPIKDKVLESYLCKTATYNLSKNDFYATCYNAFCSYFDPHTNYFSLSERSSFLSSVSANKYTFGMEVSLNENDEIVVNQILPGSTAYFSEKIESNDIITKIIYKGVTYKPTCSSLKKIEEIFSSNKFKKAEFSFRKKSGEKYSVKLSKKLMKDYQNNVYSFVIEKENTKIGYIKIPSFYSTYEGSPSSMSNDVLKEVFDLKEKKIEGLVIDLENNGGGSMQEAEMLTSSFIDIGPIAIMAKSMGTKEVIKDYTRGTAFDGPIVVLLNGSSASASEFFANAMQDYNKAIIVGNKSHGKASLQRILPLTNKKNPTEFIKLTIEKFYRVTGKSNQLEGIIPNVEIASLFNEQTPREDFNLTALDNDEVAMKVKFEVEKNNYSTAIENSVTRLKENQAIKTIEELNKKIKTIYNGEAEPIALQFKNVFEEVNKVNKLWKEIDAFSENEYPINIENQQDTKSNNDAFIKSTIKERIKSIRTNIHVFEAVNIISDLKNNQLKK